MAGDQTSPISITRHWRQVVSGFLTGQRDPPSISVLMHPEYPCLDDTIHLYVPSTEKGILPYSLGKRGQEGIVVVVNASPIRQPDVNQFGASIGCDVQ